MKRIAILLLALLLCAPAHAEVQDDFFTSSADLYYHYNARCDGADKRVPISAEAASAFDKGICPVCFPIVNDALEAPAAVSRGGTIVVRFSDAWLNEEELTGVFGFMGQDKYTGSEAHRMLSGILHGEGYNAFLQELYESGSAAGRAVTPYILPTDGTRILSRRYIGGHWYVIVRPGQKFSREWEMYWRVSSYALSMEGDVLSTEFDLQTVEDYHTLKLQAMNDSKPVCVRKADGIEIEVYRALDGNIAVIREKNADADMLENVRLAISGRYDGASLSGYMDGEDAIYCCMLTDAELRRLQGNARVELQHVEQVKNDIFRVVGKSDYKYYSDTTNELLFTVEKVNGQDPVDGSFRLELGGYPDCFVVNGEDGPTAYRYLKSGREIITMDPTGGLPAERITPLIWHENGGVFLAENWQGDQNDPDGLLFANGIEFGVRTGSAPEDEWASYHCWLVDDQGQLIGQYNNQAFTVEENGTIVMEDFLGDTWTYDPRAGD